MGQSINLNNDLRVAMQAHDSNKVGTIRLLVAAVHNEQIAKGHDLTDAEIIAVLQKEAKKRDEAIEMYEKAGRQELADKEKTELIVIKTYLPAQIGEAQVKEELTKMKAAGELGSDFGSAMKAAMVKFKGQADGKLIASLVKEML